MADRFPLIANSSSNQIQELASGDTLDLTGNMIDNCVNVKATGITTLSNTTDSTSTGTGALIISGGVGIAKNVYIGAGLSVAGTLTYEDVTNVDSVGLITAKSGVNITGGELTVGSAVTVSSVGVAKNLFVGDAIDVTKDIKVGAAATVTGSLTVSGGVVGNVTGTATGLTGTPNISCGTIAGSTGTFSGVVNIDDTTDSTSATSGSLIVDGGLGVAKNVYIGAGLSVAGTLTYEDVTNVDSVGLITAKSGVNVSGGQVTIGTGITMGIAGVATFSGTADVHLHDNVKLNVGDASDLQVYHDGSNSYVNNTGTGYLILQGNGSDDVSIRAVNGETGIAVKPNGGASKVEVYYDNSKKFETTNDGTSTTGIATATLGIDAAISVWTLGADGSNQYTFTGPGNLSGTIDPTLNLIRGQKYTFKNRSGGHPFRIQSTPNGSTGTQYNTGVTNNDGGDGTNILFDVPHNAPNVLYYQCTSHGSMGGAMYIDGSAYEISIGAGVTIGSAGVTTFSGTSDIHVVDGVKVYFGTGQDTDLYHDGSNMHLDNDTGDIYIQNHATNNPDSNIYIRAKSGENSIVCQDDGNVELYYDNDRKFRTIATGAQVESTTGDTNFIVMAEEDDSSADALLSLRVTNDSASSYLMFGDSSDANIGKIRYMHSSDDMLFYTSDTEKWRLTSAGHLENNNDTGRIKLGTSDDLQLYHDGTQSIINDSNNKFQIRSDLLQLMTASGKNEYYFQGVEDGAATVYYDNSAKLATTNDGVNITGIMTASSLVEDSLGNVRTIAQNNVSSQQTLASTDAGRVMKSTSGGLIINTSNGFGLGQAFTFINDSGSDMTITQTGTTLYLTADGSTGNKTISGRGMATGVCVASNTFYLTGNLAAA